MKDLTLAILAGGEGSRMGMPKGELRVDDRPILEYLLARFAWDGPTLLVTAPGREHPPGWKNFERELVDPVAGLGPLRGVLTGLQGAQTERVIFVTVDMPDVSRGQLDWLMARHSPDAIGSFLRRRHMAETLIEPFPSLLCRKSIEVIESRIAQGRRSVAGLADVGGFLLHDVPDDWGDDWTLNLNTPDDLLLKDLPLAERPS